MILILAFFIYCRSILEMNGHRCANNFTCPAVASTAGSALNKFTYGKLLHHLPQLLDQSGLFNITPAHHKKLLILVKFYLYVECIFLWRTQFFYETPVSLRTNWSNFQDTARSTCPLVLDPLSDPCWGFNQPAAVGLLREIGRRLV